MTPQDAVGYLAQQVCRQAEKEGTPLSEPEKRMLRWSEVIPGLECSPELNQQFEEEIDSNDFEEKVAGLLQRAKATTMTSDATAWDDALNSLRGQDAYILVMLAQGGTASASPMRGKALLIVFGVVIAVLIVVAKIFFAK